MNRTAASHLIATCFGRNEVEQFEDLPEEKPALLENRHPPRLTITPTEKRNPYGNSGTKTTPPIDDVTGFEITA